VGQQPPKGWPPKGNDNAANATATKQDGAWSAIALGPIEVLTSDPALSLVSDKADIYLNKVPEMPDGTLALEPATLAYIASTPMPTTCTTSELYDSRVMRHMTPYGDALVNHTTILPMPINATINTPFMQLGEAICPYTCPMAAGSPISPSRMFYTPLILPSCLYPLASLIRLATPSPSKMVHAPDET